MIKRVSTCLHLLLLAPFHLLQEATEGVAELGGLV